MVTVGEQLRHAREVQGRSIVDISAATRINRKFLDDIENGRMPKVPMTYVRAFIKSFAQEVGLDAAELLKSMEPAPAETEGAMPHDLTSVETVVPSSVDAAPTKNAEPERGRRHQGKILFLLSFLLLIGLAISIVWLKREHAAQPPQEISFSEVIKEQESKLTTHPQAVDSLPVITPGVRTASSPDSLMLEGIAKDTVWVHMVIDSVTTTEQTLPPQYRMHWKAKKSFLVSIGNAAGITFELNGYKLGALGSSRKPMKNILISFETLKKLSHAKDKGRDGQN